MDIAKDVAEFMKKMGYDRPLADPRCLEDGQVIMRGGHLLEEITEWMRAAYCGDIASQTDALIDLIYFAVGTLNMLGVPFDEAWKIVHAANMRKVPMISKRDCNDACKPFGWRDPKIAIKQLVERLRHETTHSSDS